MIVTKELEFTTAVGTYTYSNLDHNTWVPFIDDCRAGQEDDGMIDFMLSQMDENLLIREAVAGFWLNIPKMRVPVLACKTRRQDRWDLVFPTEISDVWGQYFTVYAEVGQHSSGGWDWYSDCKVFAHPRTVRKILTQIYSHVEVDCIYTPTAKVEAGMEPSHWVEDAFYINRMKQVYWARAHG